MARLGDDGVLRATSLLEAAALHQAVRPVCACGHAATFQPHGLWWHFERRHWDDSMVAVRKRFWCRQCQSAHRRKVRPKTVDLVMGKTDAIALPMPPEDVWKMVQRSLR